eukprot:7955266-Alexandrium_andersonii.AAC.1
MVHALHMGHTSHTSRRNAWVASMLASRAPIAEDCADCGLEDCGLVVCALAISRPRSPSAHIL